MTLSGPSMYSRAEHAIVDSVMCGEYPRLNYDSDPGNKYKSVVDIADLVAPTGVLIQGEDRQYDKDSRNQKSFPKASALTRWEMHVVVEFPSRIDFTYYEQALSAGALLVPAIKDDQNLVTHQQLTLHLASVKVLQPPRQGNQMGTRVDLRFRVEPARN